jgi:uncharacterized protein (DUF58 family)
VPVDSLTSVLVIEHHEGTKPALYIRRDGYRKACTIILLFFFIYSTRFASGLQAWRVPVDGLASVLVAEYHEGTKPALYIYKEGYRKACTIILLFFFIYNTRFAWSSQAWRVPIDRV